MPLLLPTMINEILKMTDETNGAFVGWPENNEQTAANWAAAARAYFEGIVVPTVSPAAFPAGESAFASVMTPALLLPPPATAGAMAAAFAAFAAAIVANALPTPPGVALPPPAPLIPFTVADLLPTTDAVYAATSLATKIDIWARTGTFTPATPPGAPPIPWS